MGVVCMLQISGMQAAGLMTPGLRLNDQQIEDLRRTLEPLNEALEVLVEPDHAWAATYLPDVLIYQKAVASALEHREFHDVSQLEVAKGLKKRVTHKDPKVQLLALTLLESLMKNCPEPFHSKVPRLPPSPPSPPPACVGRWSPRPTQP